MEPIALKVRAAAESVGISKYTLYDAIRAGELAFVRHHPTADRLILIDDLKAWLRKYRVCQPVIAGASPAHPANTALGES